MTEPDAIKSPENPPAPVTTSTPAQAERSKFKSAPRTTVKVTDLLKVNAKNEDVAVEVETKIEQVTVFTSEALHAAWKDFTEQRKKFQAEYQLLAQPYELIENKVVIQLLSPVQETMLNNIKSELTAHLRENLRNSSIQVVGALLESDDKKMMYTSRDKFEFLLEKNPVLREMKERLGLDSDF